MTKASRKHPVLKDFSKAVTDAQSILKDKANCKVRTSLKDMDSHCKSDLHTVWGWLNQGRVPAQSKQQAFVGYIQAHKQLVLVVNKTLKQLKKSSAA